jgi:hypothetical protein
MPGREGAKFDYQADSGLVDPQSAVHNPPISVCYDNNDAVAVDLCSRPDKCTSARSGLPACCISPGTQTGHAMRAITDDSHLFDLTAVVSWALQMAACIFPNCITLESRL